MLGPLPEETFLEGELSISLLYQVFRGVLPGRYRVGAARFENVEIEVASEDVYVSLRYPPPSPTPTVHSCQGDFNGDGQVTVDEILSVVSEALAGCPQ
jgi:hypothetical protein